MMVQQCAARLCMCQLGEVSLSQLAQLSQLALGLAGLLQIFIGDIWASSPAWTHNDPRSS